MVPKSMAPEPQNESQSLQTLRGTCRSGPEAAAAQRTMSYGASFGLLSHGAPAPGSTSLVSHGLRIW